MTIDHRSARATRPSGRDGQGPRVGASRRYAIPITQPPFRRLRVYAFDPTLSTRLDTAAINQVTLSVPWEIDPESKQDCLRPGPVGAYLEVVDVDPSSGCFYAPVDLNHPYLLAQDGLAPSEGNPQFHQQMVYAVAMTTIRHFERALGRTAFWAPRKHLGSADTAEWNGFGEYVPTLRIYPHALRGANAYYDPDKKALLFGYFPASPADARYHLPGGTVFTCLSHDIIAHETTHALLDGMHHNLLEPSNLDERAFHEGFADIVGLLQHFTHPEILRHQIANTRGDLACENLLGQLAQEFGQATGAQGALRDALGRENPKTGQWERIRPDPTRIQTTTEPHARGALLVAAIFDAFLSIYRARSDDLLRIATNGTGVLPPGHLHPDLVSRLAGEAAKSAQHLLTMCIRALDYCPPVDLTFGDYLRAIITADSDLVPDDDLGYRIAIVEAFRQHGIYPRDVRSLSVDSLRWAGPARSDFKDPWPLLETVRDTIPTWNLASQREELYKTLRTLCDDLHKALRDVVYRERESLGLDLRKPDAPFYLHSIRPARRVGPDGQMLTDLILEITQQKAGYLNPRDQNRVDKGRIPADSAPIPDFQFRGGCTLVIDLATSLPRYCIVKRVASQARLARQRAFLLGEPDSSRPALHADGWESRDAIAASADSGRLPATEQQAPVRTGV